MIPKHVDPAVVAAEMLSERLPGFETRISAGRDAVNIRGALPIGATATAEMITYPVMCEPSVYESPVGIAKDIRDITETRVVRELRIANETAAEREQIKEIIEPSIRHIAENIQRLAIEAVGLRPVIDEEVRRAVQRARAESYEAGRAVGRVEGIAEGRTEGRAQASADIVAFALNWTPESGS